MGNVKIVEKDDKVFVEPEDLPALAQAEKLLGLVSLIH